MDVRNLLLSWLWTQPRVSLAAQANCKFGVCRLSARTCSPRPFGWIGGAYTGQVQAYCVEKLAASLRSANSGGAQGLRRLLLVDPAPFYAVDL
jgi:hypothetical protein